MLDAGHIQKNSFCVFNSKSTLAAAENITVNKKPARRTAEHKEINCKQSLLHKSNFFGHFV